MTDTIRTPSESNPSIAPESPAVPHAAACQSLVLQFDGTSQAFDISNLLDDGFVAELNHRIATATNVILHPWAVVHNLPAETRRCLLTMLAQVGEGFRVRAVDGLSACISPFEAALGSFLDRNNLTDISRWQDVALEVAAVFHGGAADEAAHRIRQRLLDFGIRPPLPQSLAGQIRGAAGQVAPRETLTPKDAAELVLRCYQDQRDGEDSDPADTPPLRYYREDFYRWTGTRWARLADKQIKAQVVQLLQRNNRVAILTDSFVNSVITNLSGMVLLDCWQEQLPFLVTAESPLEIHRPRLMVMRNGMIDLDQVLRTGQPPEVFPHEPRFFTTVSLPYDFIVGATCPLWLVTLSDILPRRGVDDHRIEVLQEFMGQTLVQGDSSFEQFMIFVGRGANGKSTVLRPWEALLGPDNVSHVPLDGLQGEFRLHQMMGKLANIASDMTRMDKVEEGRLKELTSGEAIQVNRKHKAPITMVPTARLVFATNELPPIVDRTDGVWRRMLVIPFYEQFSPERRDRCRAASLLEELPGIFNWALAGLVRLYQRGGFTPCAVCQQCVADHRHNSDPFRQFVDECVMLEVDWVIRCQDLYDAYVMYCDESGRRPRNAADFGKQVQELPGTTRRRSGTGSRPYEYTGIGLREGIGPPHIARRVNQRDRLRRY